MPNLNLPIKLRQSRILLALKLFVWTGVGLILFSHSTASPFNYSLWQRVWSVLLLALVIIGDLYQLVWWYNNFYKINSKELAHFQGFFWQKRRIVRFPTLDLISLRQSFLGKIFNYGSITLRSSETEEQITLKGIPRPQHYVKIFEKILPGAEQF